MKRLSKKQMRIFAVGQLGWSTLSGIISAWFVTFYLPTQVDIEGGAIQYIVPDKDSGIVVEENPVWDAVKATVAKHGYDTKCIGTIERTKFYKKAKKAYITISTSERQPYGCIILQKGVL